MQPSKDKIKDIFSSKLSGYKPDVPNSVWENIEKSFTESGNIPLHTRKVKLYRRLAVAASIAAFLIVSLIFIEINKDDKLPLTSSPISEKTIELSEKTIQVDKEKIQTEQSTSQKNIFANHNKKVKEEVSNKIAHVTEEDSLTVNTDSNIVITENKQFDGQNPDKATVDTKSSVDKEKNRKEKMDEYERMLQSSQQNLFAEATGRKGNGLSISMGGGASFGREANPSTIVKSPVSKMMTMSSNTSEEGFSSQSPKYSYKDEPVKVEHRQPISFGINLNKRLNDKLSIETGITYTYLSSKIKSKENSQYRRNDSQYFHYLGIPISLNYHFVQWGKADFYATFGGMIQKDISGRLKGEQISEKFLNGGSFKEKISQDNPQLSVMATVGASYPIYEKLHLYANIGGSYYFDAGNEYKTIYSDKKLQLNLNAGIKFEF